MDNQTNTCCNCEHFNPLHKFCSKLTVRHPHGKVYLERMPESPACKTEYQPKSVVEEEPHLIKAGGY